MSALEMRTYTSSNRQSQSAREHTRAMKRQSPKTICFIFEFVARSVCVSHGWLCRIPSLSILHVMTSFRRIGSLYVFRRRILPKLSALVSCVLVVHMPHTYPLHADDIGIGRPSIFPQRGNTSCGCSVELTFAVAGYQLGVERGS